MPITQGIHHVTAIASDAQSNVNFYTRTLGLRLVKATVNFDDPTSYHFYYGDETGAPGTILTFFIWPGGMGTRDGRGEVNTTTLAVPVGALDWWKAHLQKHGVEVEVRGNRLFFHDPDGLNLELVETDRFSNERRDTGEVPGEFGIRSVESVRLNVGEIGLTADVLTRKLGFVRASDALFKTENPSGGHVEVVEVPNAPRAGGGVGSVHHVAFRAASDEEQLSWRDELIRAGLSVSPVIDRSYFHSIYFREPGGVLFEIATDEPGFATDETLENLGTSLKLPSQYEAHRAEIERRIQPITLQNGAKIP